MLKKKWFWGLIIIIVAGGAIFYSSRGEKPIEYSSIQVERGDLIQSVSETGSVVAESEIRYGWETSGRVVQVYKNVGDTVRRGDLLAQLDARREQSATSQALARVEAAEAALALRKDGVTDEQKREAQAAIDQAQAVLDQRTVELEQLRVQQANIVALAETAVREAEVNLSTSQQTNTQSVDDAYDDAVLVLADTVDAALNALVDLSDIQYTHEDLLNGRFSIDIKETKARAVYDLVGAANAGEWVAQFILDQNKGLRGDVAALVATNNPSVSDIDRALAQSLVVLQSTKQALDSMLTGLNAEVEATATEKTTLETDRTAIETARTNIITAQQAISTAQLGNNTSQESKQLAYETAVQKLEDTQEEAAQNIAAAEAALRVQAQAVATQQAAYDRLVATPRSVDLASLEADVSRTKAALYQAQVDADKTRLFALSDGVISALDVEIGENITANQDIVTIISENHRIEVDIAESDIAKIMLDDMVKITLDAFGDDVSVDGSVLRIDPAETELSGVVYYQTDILFEETSSTPDIRSGMTANIEIFTDTQEDVLIIPERAILQKDGNDIVRVLTNIEETLFEERIVERGLRGNNGQVAILAGVEEGEEVITFLKEE